MNLSQTPTRVRFGVVAVTAMMSVLLYLDRFCISFAEVFIKQDLGLSDVQVGWMLSAFFWTYALGQVPSGWLSDRFGARLMLTLYVLLWSVFTGLTGAAFGFTVLMLLRFGFGFAQAGAYPTGASIVSKWVPFTARGLASSIVAVGGRVGGFLALLATGYVIVWLTPASTPPEIQPADILRGPQLCHELIAAAGPGATGAGREVLASLPTDVREIVGRYAALYAAELQRVEAARPKDNLPPDAGLGQQIAAMGRRMIAEFRQKKTDRTPQVSPLTADEQASLAAALTGIIVKPDFFDEDNVAGMSLEKEAKRILKKPAVERSEQNSRRLNRLVLESLGRDSIRKLYVAGWRPMMFAYGTFGLLVAGMIWFLTRNRPAEHPGCNAAEIELIEGDARMAAARNRGKIRGVPLGRLLTSRSMWLDCLSQCFLNVGWVFLMTWAPRYYQDVHNMPAETRAFMTAIPPLVGWFGMLAGGALTDRLVQRIGLRWGRALPMSLSKFVAMGAYLACLANPSPWFAVVMFSIVAFTADLGIAAAWAFKQDVGGRHVGSILGWGNMWGNLGAAVTPPILIAIVGSNQNWSAAFVACAIAFFLSGIAALGIDATVPIAVEEEDELTTETRRHGEGK